MGQKADAQIRNFLKKVRKKYKVEKAIFFGSRARGDYLLHSDYDVIIVSPDFKDIFFSQRIAWMYEFWDYYPLEIEPICYTPEEFKQKNRQIGIVQQAVKEGIDI